MANKNNNINRRGFLKRILAGGAVVSAAAVGCNSPKNESLVMQEVPTDKMTYRLNNKGEKVSILGYGCMRLPTKSIEIDGKKESVITGDNTIGGVISDIQTNGGGVNDANYSNFTVSGLTITANNKCVGGISGIISNQTLDGVTVENVTIVSKDVRKGTVSGALGAKSTIKNISVKNVTGANNVVGATYDGGTAVIVNGNVYDKE